MKKAAILIAVLSLFGTITNLIPLSATIVLYIFIVLPFLPIDLNKIPLVPFYTGTLFTYFLLWTLIYDPLSLVDYNFYRRDGNVFISFMPLLGLSLLRLNFNFSKLLKRFVYFASTINFLLMFYYHFLGMSLFHSTPMANHFLFIAHNAAGGFMAILVALNLGLVITNHRRKLLILFLVINILGLVSTDSRGSILGVLLSALIFFLPRLKVLPGMIKRQMVPLFILFILISHTVFLSFSYRAWTEIGKPIAFGDFRENYGESVESLNQQIGGRAWTVYLRGFIRWPQALDNFFSSPLVGTGFGSFNDRPYRLVGIKNVFQINRADNIFHNSSHAHHTFLHVMSETGLLGLLLIVILLKKLYKTIILLPTNIRYPLVLAFWTLVNMSFTEHRLFTPSNALPFTIIVGLAIANNRYSRQMRSREISRSDIM